MEGECFLFLLEMKSQSVLLHNFHTLFAKTIYVTAVFSLFQRILDEKNEEINKLTTETKTPPALSSSTNKAPKAEYTANLNKILCEREAQIEMLQKQLQGATKEMEETTDILNRISHEKGAFEKRAKQLGVLNADLKEQLKVLNERCQQLQDEIAFLEESYQIKDKDVSRKQLFFSKQLLRRLTNYSYFHVKYQHFIHYQLLSILAQ